MKILLVLKDFREKLGNFTETNKAEVVSYGHEVNCATSVNAGQRLVNDGFKPELAYIDNCIAGAAYFSKQMRARFSDAQIYLVVATEPSDLESPNRLNLNGFVVGTLTVDEVISKAGDLRPPVEEIVEEARDDDDGKDVSGQVLKAKLTPFTVNPKEEADRNGGEKRSGLVITIPFPWRREKEEEPKANKKTVDLVKKDDKFNETIKQDDLTSGAPGLRHRFFKHRLAFPAVLGIFAISIILVGVTATPKPAPAKGVLPSYYGMDLENLKDSLARSGRPYEIIEVRSAGGTDLVVSQDPPAGTALSEVDKIQVMFSKKTNTDTADANADIGTGQDVQTGDGGGGEAALPASPVPVATAAAQVPVSVAPKAAGLRPSVSVSASRTSGPSSGFIVKFTASASDPDGGRIVSYSWSCGGTGSSTSCEMASNIAPATRTVSCTVTDDEGLTATSSVTISMN